jgi:plastocyanin
MKKILLSLAALSLFSCSNNVDLAIDNPSNNPIVVKIDTLTVEVGPRDVAWVEMGQGEHQITLENDSIVKFNFTEEMYMLNPTLTEYLMTEEFYGDEMSQMTYQSSLPKKTITFLGTEIDGNYDVIKGLINPVKWDVGPREELPEMVEMDADEAYTTLLKIYDSVEFINLIQSSYSAEEAATTEEPPVTQTPE